MVYNEMLIVNRTENKGCCMPDSYNYDNVNENSQEKESWCYWLFDRLRTLWFFLSYFSAGIAVGIEGRPRVLWKLIMAFVGAGGNNLFSIFTIFQSAWKADKTRRRNDIYDRECTSWAKLHVALVSSLFFTQIGVIFLGLAGVVFYER